MRTFTIAVLVSAALAPAAFARQDAPIHCGNNHACIAQVARASCLSRHDGWHCRIWKRWQDSRTAHVADTCTSVACDQAYLVQLIGPTEARCAEGIIAVEDSTYAPVRYFADNPANSPWFYPYGIPQANPGSKMASAGPDWQTNPRTQLRWMVGYVDGAFGDACAAYAHRIAAGSY